MSAKDIRDILSISKPSQESQGQPSFSHVQKKQKILQEKKPGMFFVLFCILFCFVTVYSVFLFVVLLGWA